MTFIVGAKAAANRRCLRGETPNEFGFDPLSQFVSELRVFAHDVNRSGYSKYHFGMVSRSIHDEETHSFGTCNLGRLPRSSEFVYRLEETLSIRRRN